LDGNWTADLSCGGRVPAGYKQVLSRSERISPNRRGAGHLALPPAFRPAGPVGRRTTTFIRSANPGRIWCVASLDEISPSGQSKVAFGPLHPGMNTGAAGRRRGQSQGREIAQHLVQSSAPHKRRAQCTLRALRLAEVGTRWRRPGLQKSRLIARQKPVQIEEPAKALILVSEAISTISFVGWIPQRARQRVPGGRLNHRAHHVRGQIGNFRTPAR